MSATISMVLQWLTVRDVMARTKFSRSTVYEHMNAGRLKSKKVGGSRRIAESDLLEFMASFNGAGEIDATEQREATRQSLEAKLNRAVNNLKSKREVSQ